MTLSNSHLNFHCFVAGTDTGVGKTVVTGYIASYIQSQGRRVATQKWVQTGCNSVSEDIDAHLSAMELTRADVRPYLEDINPYCFSLAASPHLAAQHENTSIDPGRLKSAFRRLTQSFDSVIVEGAGGLLVPYSDSHTLLDVVSDLSLPVILVAANKLGCINHTLLSLSELTRRGLSCLGVVLNRIPQDTPLTETDRLILDDNQRVLQTLCEVPVVDFSDLKSGLLATLITDTVTL